MAFEEFTKKAVVAAGDPWITIQRRGIIALNHPAYLMLGEPKAVTLLYDGERHLVGLRPTDPAKENAYAVRSNPNGTSHVVTGTLFTTHYGIPTDKARRWPARLIEDGILAIDISEEPRRVGARIVVY